MNGQVSIDTEKMNSLKEMNISYNQFSGLVFKAMAKLDILNMTMINEKGLAVALLARADKISAFASEE